MPGFKMLQFPKKMRLLHHLSINYLVCELYLTPKAAAFLLLHVFQPQSPTTAIFLVISIQPDIKNRKADKN